VPELQPGDPFGSYRVESLLGEGAMGTVYRARRDGADEDVALKIIKSEFAADDQYRQRFLHEARAAATVDHPHLISVIDAGEFDGRQYLVMHVATGQSLDKRVADGGPLSALDTVSLAEDIGGALDALHAVDLVHRDVKPANILLRDGEAGAALTDFGLAKGTGYTDLTADGQVVGSLDYLAPERIRGEQAVPASDIYALGCVLVECLVGHAPFGGGGMVKTLFGHLESPPPDPGVERDDLSGEFCVAVQTAMAKDAADRPASGTEYARSLREALEG
jgi:serine/threonine-protein kinase